MARPVREYRYTFQNEATPVTFTFETRGESTCIARRRAFERLEVALKTPEAEALPSKGWYLGSQQMINSFGR